MLRFILATCFVVLSILACSPETDAPAVSPAPAEQPAARPEDCPLTAPVSWRPSDAPGRDPLPHGPYFRSPDGRIATSAQPHWHTGGMKVLWLKPVGSRLEVSGRRLEGPAPPLRAEVPQGYPGDYQASGVFFPTSGCWEVEARADGSILQFVVYVLPAPPALPR